MALYYLIYTAIGRSVFDCRELLNHTCMYMFVHQADMKYCMSVRAKEDGARKIVCLVVGRGV